MRLLHTSTALVIAVSAALAQDNPQPVTIGNFVNEGAITTGYRWVDIAGYQPKYQELFDLNGGFRVLDFSLFGRAKEGTERFADRYSLTVTGLGGEPFSTAQFMVRKAHLYDLRAGFRQSYYYWNRNDRVSSNGFTAITSNHDWSTVRKLGNVNLVVTATNDLRFSFEYYRNTRDGVTFTTRTLDYFGSSSTWGSFARANPYYLVAPLSEDANRVAAGVDYTRHHWNFHYRLGYQQFEDAVNGQNPNPERSINTNDPTTAVEIVSHASWLDFRKLTTPVSEFIYDGKITPRLETRGGYIFYRYRGPASLDYSANGIARTNSGGTTDAPYAFSMSARANNTEPNHVLDQGFTYRIYDWWRVLADYRYSRFDVDATAQFQSVFNGAPVAGVSNNHWSIGTSALDFRMLFTPTATLVVNAGVRFWKSDVENLLDGVVDPTRTKRIKTVWPVASVYYQPVKMLTIRADIEEINNGTSYTRITPHTDIGGRIAVRARPVDKLTIENATVIRNRQLISADYRSTIRANSTMISWEFDPRLSVYGGFSYDSFFASDFTTFLRGTAPLTNELRDQTVNRVWQGGIAATVTPRFGIDFSGNYIRTNGLGEIGGEPPLYGPVTFPYATGSIHYDFPRWGQFAVKLQRTYYIEQIITANNFSANLLTLAWTWKW